MQGLSIWHLLIIGVVLALLFGGRFSPMMADVAKGLREFKKGLKEESHE